MDVYIGILLAIFVSVHGHPTSDLGDYRLSGLEMELLQVVYRHGDRTPTKTFPTDPNVGFWSKLGYGQLTNIGKMQLFELGQMLRARYIPSFLNTSYNRDEVYVQSTDVDRTLMSAQANLAGLYPPKDDHIWNPDLLWQPIPVHTLPTYMDYVFDDAASCPRYDELWDEQMKSPEMRNFDLQNKDLYDLLTNCTERTVDDMKSVSTVYSNLLAAGLHNLTIPDWLNATTKMRMKECHDRKFVYIAKTHEMQRLVGGPVWGQLLTNIRNKINGTTPERKGFFYSSHDTILAAAMSALGFFDGIAPPYSSALFVELFTDSVGSRFVRFLYRNTTSVVDPLIVLTVPGCPSGGGHVRNETPPPPCPLDILVLLTEGILSNDVIHECDSDLHPVQNGLQETLGNHFIDQNSVK